MTKKTEIRNYYFIDSENVHNYGMDGMERLGGNDRVRIYYRANAAYLNIDLHRKIYESPAVFEYEFVDLDIRNAIDVKIVEYISSQIACEAAEKFFIVSNDNDYDKQIAAFRNRGANVSRIAFIGETPSEKSVRKKNAKEKKCGDEVRTFVEQNLKDKKYRQKREEIIEALGSCTERGALNNTLQKYFDGSDLKQLMKTLKPLTNELYKGKK